METQKINIEEHLKNEELIKDLKNGINIIALTRKYDIDFYTARLLKSRIKKDDEVFKINLLKYYNQEPILSLNEIAEKMNLSYDLIKNSYKVLKLSTKDRGGKSYNNRKEIIKSKRTRFTPIKNPNMVGTDTIVLTEGKRAKTDDELLKLIEGIKSAIFSNIISYVDLIKEFNLNDFTILKLHKEKRKEVFNKMYINGKSAKEILDSDFNKSLGKYMVMSINSVYNIVIDYKHARGGHKNFNIHFEAKAIIKTLFSIGKKTGYIVEYLNKNGYKTPEGKKFTVSNLWYTIKQIKKENEKVL